MIPYGGGQYEAPKGFLSVDSHTNSSSPSHTAIALWPAVVLRRAVWLA
jgi:hypothetical protein